MKKWLVTVALGCLIVCAAAGGTLAVYTKSQAFSGTLTLEPAASTGGGEVGGGGAFIPVPGPGGGVTVDPDGGISITGKGDAVSPEDGFYQVPAEGYQVTVSVDPCERGNNGADSQEGVFFAGRYDLNDPNTFQGNSIHFSSKNKWSTPEYRLTIRRYDVNIAANTSYDSGAYFTDFDYTPEYLEVNMDQVKKQGYDLAVVVTPESPDAKPAEDMEVALQVYLRSPDAGVEDWLRIASMTTIHSRIPYLPDQVYGGVRANSQNGTTTVFRDYTVSGITIPDAAPNAWNTLPAAPATSPDAAAIEVSESTASSEITASSETPADREEPIS